MKQDQDVISSDHPVYDACESGNVEAVKQFLDNGISIYAIAEDKASILAHARCSGSFETYKLFFDRGCDPNHVKGAFNKTEVFHVASFEDTRWLKLVIEKGGDVNHKSRYGATPYHIAAATGTKEHVALMLEAGADTSIMDDLGNDDFMKAAAAGNFWYAEELLKKGRDINRMDTTGSTALLRCAKSGMYDHVKWLIEHGADVSLREVTGKSALYFAETNKHTQVAELLLQHGAEI